MSKTTSRTILAADSAQRKALASPLRLEILGLFTSAEPLAISDMARLMGRSAGSLYHHVGLLEQADLLHRAGTRPKGKRYEALFEPSATRIELDASSGEEDVLKYITKTMSSALRMVESDLAAALTNKENRTDGPQRNLFATRMHLRASPRILARINKHLQAIEELVATEATRTHKPSTTDQHLSLTLALLPLKGRGHGESNKGE